MTAYLIIIVLYMAPPAASFFAETFFASSAARDWVNFAGVFSPFSAALGVPLKIDAFQHGSPWPVHLAYLGFYAALNASLLGVMTWLFNTRWRVAQ
jgi:hypothetical protein